MMSKIRFENVHKTFVSEQNSLETLKNINIHVESGEFVSIIGPSGCGKSTILHLMTNIVSDYDGRIYIDQEPLESYGHVLGYMHQKDLLMPWRTMLDNVALPLELRGVKKKQAYETIDPYLEMFGLAGFEKAYPNELSGGMRQRAALLRTFMVESEILLFDEPFAALDAINRHKMQSFLLETREKFERTVIFITHDIDEAIFLSDRIYVLSQRPAEVIKEVVIDIKRPRSRHVLLEEEFLKIKEMLVEALE